MAQPRARLPAHMRPRPKPAASSSATPLRPGGGVPSAAPSRPASTPPDPISRSADTSRAATTALVRRILCPAGDKQRALDELLPPLTSRNDVDLELYAILAVVVKEFVYSWYAKITPDRTFVAEVVDLVAHCTRDLEGRARRVDWVRVLGDEVPELVRRHVIGTALRIPHGARSCECRKLIWRSI